MTGTAAHQVNFGESNFGIASISGRDSIHLMAGGDNKLIVKPAGCSISLDLPTMTFFAEQHGELERNFMMALYDNPKDSFTRVAYADWLEEHDRPDTAKQVRNGWTFGVA